MAIQTEGVPIDVGVGYQIADSGVGMDDETLALLEAYGWTLRRTRSDSVGELARPGKDGYGISATFGIGGSNLFYPFTTNAPPFEVGKALRPLRDENVLVIGSGHLTHNLRDWARGQGAPAPYAREFQSWVYERITSRKSDELIGYRSLSAHGVRAHPTDEHFLPLFVALGAAGEDDAERVYDAIDAGVLAMDAYYFGARS